MFKTFKETRASLQDKTYGQTIIGHTLSYSVWYWTKYYLLMVVITAILLVSALTYFVPQLPHLVRDNFPNAWFSLKSGHFSTSLTQPVTLGPSDAPIIIDTQATNSALLDNKDTGVLVLSDRIVVKQGTDPLQTQSLSDIPDFYLEKKTLLSWVSTNQILLWLGAVVSALVLTLIFSAFIWLGRMLGFAFWALGFWLLAKVIKRSLTYVEAANLVLFASVLPFLMNSILVLLPNQLLSLLSLGVFIYFGVTWLVNLPKSTAKKISLPRAKK